MGALWLAFVFYDHIEVSGVSALGYFVKLDPFHNPHTCLAKIMIHSSGMKSGFQKSLKLIEPQNVIA